MGVGGEGSVGVRRREDDALTATSLWCATHNIPLSATHLAPHPRTHYSRRFPTIKRESYPLTPALTCRSPMGNCGCGSAVIHSRKSSWMFSSLTRKVSTCSRGRVAHWRSKWTPLVWSPVPSNQDLIKGHQLDQNKGSPQLLPMPRPKQQCDINITLSHTRHTPRTSVR